MNHKTIEEEITNSFYKNFIKRFIGNSYSISYQDNLMESNIYIDIKDKDILNKNELFKEIEINYKKGYFVYNKLIDNKLIVQIDTIDLDSVSKMFVELNPIFYSTLIKFDKNLLYISMIKRQEVGNDYFFLFGEVQNFDFILDYHKIIYNDLDIEVNYSKNVINRMIDHFV